MNMNLREVAATVDFVEAAAFPIRDWDAKGGTAGSIPAWAGKPAPVIRLRTPWWLLELNKPEEWWATTPNGWHERAARSR